MKNTTKAKCKPSTTHFSAPNNRKVAFDFAGGDISSDGGLLLLSQFEKSLNLLKRAGSILQNHDKREQAKVKHSYSHMLKQRVFGLVAGYEDLNDHDKLCKDPMFQTAVGRDEDLASDSTLCRLENVVDHDTCVKLAKLMIETFIESFKEAPTELVLDFDATDTILHGNQEQAFYHGYYQNYCYLPLYVFCGHQLLVSYLRPAHIDGAAYSHHILYLLVRRFRREWPGVRIVFRGDSGFCRHEMLTWCENNRVDYITGLAKNARVNALCKDLHQAVELEYQQTQTKVKKFSETVYQADSWTKPRRVIAKAEYNSKGANNRYIVTTLTADGQHLYEDVYCARGEMENRIKEQGDLFSGRTSCHAFIANQFRLILSSLAYILMERFRARVLCGTSLAKAACGTIRLKLVKIGAIIRRNTRKIYISLSSSFTQQYLFWEILQSVQLNR